MFGRISDGRFSQMFSRPHSEGAGAVALAAAMPLAVLALAVTSDYAKVSHFRSSVQKAADAVAAQPDIALGNDALAGQVADVVFLGHAPRGAGTPNVGVKSSAAAV